MRVEGWVRLERTAILVVAMVSMLGACAAVCVAAPVTAKAAVAAKSAVTAKSAVAAKSAVTAKAALTARSAKAVRSGPVCRSVSFEGEVDAGQAFRKQFTPGLEFFLEPLRSGWIVRVLAVKDGREERGPHDYAEVATPPYQSVSPLLISTDWAFRAQDAAAWNPRPFRYAQDARSFARLSVDEDRIVGGGVSGGGSAVEADAAAEVLKQPQASLRMLDVSLVPGTHDEGRMAAAVALHGAETPVQVVQSSAPTALGALRHMKFRVRMDLAKDARALPGVAVQQFSCNLRPTD